MPNAKPTVYGNVDVFTRVDGRSTASTYMVADDPAAYRGLQVMKRADYQAIAERQDAYTREQEMIVIDGDISNAPEVRARARLIIERPTANIAAMQKVPVLPDRGRPGNPPSP